MVDGERIPIPLLFHRSHKYTAEALAALPPHNILDNDDAESRRPRKQKMRRLRRNLLSCSSGTPLSSPSLGGGLNLASVTRYYDDAQLIATMEDRVLPRLLHLAKPRPKQQQGKNNVKRTRAARRAEDEAAAVAAAWRRLRSDPVLSRVPVLRADVFRLGVTWLAGGWWLDADVVCIDDLAETLSSQALRVEAAAAAGRWRRHRRRRWQQQQRRGGEGEAATVPAAGRDIVVEEEEEEEECSRRGRVQAQSGPAAAVFATRSDEAARLGGSSRGRRPR